MSLERISKALEMLGLSQIDVRVYIYLALKGPRKAKSIVDKLKINKQQIMRSLGNLQNKGIIVGDLDKKNTFCALPFEKVLDLLIKMKKEQAKSLQESREELISSWQTNKREKSENN